MEELKKQYKSICDTLKLLSDYQEVNHQISEDAKKMFQFDCTYLLSVLAYEDEKVSDREKQFINDILGIEISDLTLQTFSHANSKFDIEAVSRTVAYLCGISEATWEKLGAKKEDPATSVVKFYEDLGEAFLQLDNPKNELSKLYHFIAINKDYIKGLPNPGVPSSAGRMISSISRDFFGGGSGQTATTTNSPKENEQNIVKQEEMEDPMGELQKLVGLTEIKKDVEELINLVKIQKIREERGMKSVPVSLHLVFTGNPGTGKTTVARILAQLYRQIGVLESGQLIETDRSGLVAGYVGQTAIKTQEMIKQAMGGVLFIDEAYALAKEGNDFGQEAISTILKAMEDNRDKFVVIVAGYDELMDKFINSNPGLKSRFNKYFHFPDYTAEEMVGIFRMNCKKYQYELDEDAEEIVREHMQWLEDNKDENFANGRDVRNYFEKIITQQAGRVAAMESPSDEDVARITKEDIEKAVKGE